MQLLIPGKSYAKKMELHEAAEDLVVTVIGSDGTTLATPTVTPLDDELTLDEAAVPNDTYLVLIEGSDPTPGWYLPTSAWGENPVEIVTYDATSRRAYLRDPLMVHVAESTTLAAITASYDLSVPADYAGDLVFVSYSSDLRSQREAYLINAHELVNPFDLFREIPRLQGQQVNRPEIMDVASAALEELRGRLWGDEIKLDNCQIPSRCLPWMRCWVKSHLTEQGIDILGGDVDRLDALSKFNRDLADEYKNLVTAKIWTSSSAVTATAARAGWRVVI